MPPSPSNTGGSQSKAPPHRRHNSPAWLKFDWPCGLGIAGLAGVPEIGGPGIGGLGIGGPGIGGQGIRGLDSGSPPFILLHRALALHLPLQLTCRLIGAQGCHLARTGLSFLQNKFLRTSSKISSSLIDEIRLVSEPTCMGNPNEQ